MKDVLRRCALGALLSALAHACAAAAPADFGPQEYARLEQARFAADGIAVPAGGVEIRRDVATIRLESGRIFPMEPVHGVVTGFVFTGKGRFHMDVPSAFELAQLRRFAKDDRLTEVDTPFDALVVRSVEPLPGPLGSPPGAGMDTAPNVIAQDRLRRWIEDYGLDADGRIVAGLRMPGDDYLLADVKTSAYGWLTFQYEPWDLEEVTLEKLHGAGGFLETWVSLDRASERDPSGGPTSDPHRIVDVTHVDITADLTGHRAELIVGGEEALPDPVTFRSRVDMVVLRDGIRALPFLLAGRARVTAVRGPDGAAIPFVRNAYGERSATLDDDRFVNWLFVLPDRPLRESASYSIEVDYVMRTVNYLGGRIWYPAPPEPLNDRHTARLTVVGPESIEACAPGERVSDRVENGVRTSVWEIRRPAMMVGFTFGKGFKRETIRLDGAPEVVSFGVPTGAVTGNMVRNVAVDVARSMKFFEDYFDVRLPAKQLRVAAISAHHGQAFDGLLEVGQSTYNEEHPGYTELFRAHEAAHEIWGHLVSWKSYRDQWLSEAFAQYSALLFMEQVLPKHEYFDSFIEGMANEQLGSLKNPTHQRRGGWGTLQSPTLRAELGPIAAGYRAGSARVPNGYVMQSYTKGALVLNTLRTVLSTVSRDKDVFRLVMQEFVHDYAGRAPSTEDLERLLERRVPAPWDAFFQEYVYGTALPTFTWTMAPPHATEGGAWRLDLSVEMSDVPEGFAIPVPLELDFGRSKTRYTFVMMDEAKKTFRFTVPSVPRKVNLDPGEAILARIVRR